MTRRVKFGCLGAALLVFVLVGGWTYFSLIRPAQAILDDIDHISELAAQNEGIFNQEPFSPPTSGELTESQLERFSRVQMKMESELGDSYSFLHDRALRIRGLFIGEDGGRERRNVGIRDVVRAIDGLGAVLTEAKRIQIDGLNEEGFSRDEYRWVRERFYHALGFSRYDVYLEDFAADLKTGKNQDALESFVEEERETEAPLAHNKDLSSLYSDRAKAWNPFREFGL